MAEEIGAVDTYSNEVNLKMRDLEEKQRILKRRVLLIGQNLIDSKEKNNSDILELKKSMEEIKISLSRVTSFIKEISGEMQNFAKKDDLEILSKQAKMFQPLKNIKSK